MRQKNIRGIITACLGICLFMGALSGCSRPETVIETEKAHSSTSNEQYRKDMDEIKKSMRGDIKIKLKKDGKGAYSWEISGKDAYEVVKTNGILAKKVNSD